DGIRDFHVTGVQTCALPISAAGPASSGPASDGAPVPRASEATRTWSLCCFAFKRAEDGIAKPIHLGRRPLYEVRQHLTDQIGQRSEERRVGERGSRGRRGMI